MYAWDAGTEEGDTYSGDNLPTTPSWEEMRAFMAGNIEDEAFVSMDGRDNLQVLPVGAITFELQGDTSGCTILSKASMADMTESFDIRIRRQGGFRTINCTWAKTRRRCQKMTFENGSRTGIRVRHLCPESCSLNESV